MCVIHTKQTHASLLVFTVCSVHHVSKCNIVKLHLCTSLDADLNGMLQCSSMFCCC